MDVQFALHGDKGHAFVGDEAAPDAEMEFSRAGDGLLIISHTEVGEHLRGQGTGRKLLDRVVAYARENGIKIIPLCPYAKSVFDKTPELGDVLR